MLYKRLGRGRHPLGRASNPWSGAGDFLSWSGGAGRIRFCCNCLRGGGGRSWRDDGSVALSPGRAARLLSLDVGGASLRAHPRRAGGSETAISCGAFCVFCAFCARSYRASEPLFPP